MAAWVEAALGGDLEVFDSDMARSDGAEGEMMKMLRIGLSCCHVDVDLRPDIKEAVERIEEVKEE